MTGSGPRPGTGRPGFLWGAGTAAHQVEGGNVNNNIWEWEHAEGTAFQEPSGDACDSYNRWSDDLDAVVEMGLNSYRFSVEWSRIEPEEGQISRVAIDHYRRIVESCRDRGLDVIVTLLHFSLPRWMYHSGGLADPRAVKRFARFCEIAAPIVEKDVRYVTTINEPNMTNMLYTRMRSGFAAADEARLDPALTENLINCHRAGTGVLKSLNGPAVGWTVANHNFVLEPGSGDEARELAHRGEDVFLEAAREDDYIGVQTYTRTRLADSGTLPPADGAELTDIGWEFYPDAAEIAIRHTASVARGVPILVTENGIAAADDMRRIEYISRAVEGVNRCRHDGIDVRGYLHWSALDNFEWIAGFGPQFGLVSVDRTTFARSIKPSGYHLGRLANEA